MKIVKKRLRQIIKEEVARAQLQEGEQKWEMLDKIVQALGPEEALQEIVKAMSDYEAISNLQHVLDMHDVPDDSFSDDDMYDSEDYDEYNRELTENKNKKKRKL